MYECENADEMSDVIRNQLHGKELLSHLSFLSGHKTETTPKTTVHTHSVWKFYLYLIHIFICIVQYTYVLAWTVARTHACQTHLECPIDRKKKGKLDLISFVTII